MEGIFHGLIWVAVPALREGTEGITNYLRMDIQRPSRDLNQAHSKYKNWNSSAVTATVYGLDGQG
jgi:hypothetical protein